MYCNVLTTSMKHNRIERPWLDVGIKVVRPTHRGVEAGLTQSGLLDLTAVHDRSMLCASQFTGQSSMAPTSSVRGSIPTTSVGHAGASLMTVPSTAPTRLPHLLQMPLTPQRTGVPAICDVNGNGCDWHGRGHFIEVYCNELLRLMRLTAGLPSPEATWKDAKVHKGLRGELQAVFRAAKILSQGLATAASLEQTENEERKSRGSRSEDS